MEKKVIAVIGGTGVQGGAVVKQLLEDPSQSFTCRVLTRTTTSPKALELQQKGCDVVEANTYDVDSLKRAFKGVYGVYAVTDFFASLDVEKEITQGKNIADAVKAMGVQHTIWSTFEGVKDIVVKAGDDSFDVLEGGWIVPHFDSKGEISKYFREINVPFTDFYTSYYLENFFSLIQRIGENKYALMKNLGDVPLSVVAVDDIGRAAVTVFKNKDKYLNKEFYVVSDKLPVKEIAEKLTRYLGVDVTYIDVPYKTYASLGFPGAADIANMFHFQKKFPHIFNQNRDVNRCKELIPDLESIDSWIVKHKQQLLDNINKLEEKARQEKKE